MPRRSLGPQGPEATVNAAQCVGLTARAVKKMTPSRRHDATARGQPARHDEECHPARTLAAGDRRPTTGAPGRCDCFLPVLYARDLAFSWHRCSSGWFLPLTFACGGWVSTYFLSPQSPLFVAAALPRRRARDADGRCHVHRDRGCRKRKCAVSWKSGLILLAGVNAALFHRGAWRTIDNIGA